MSSINPNNIDGAFPIAGQDNDSQGFRDNFTNLKNNLTFAKQEIEDLQNNVLLKSALTGTVLNNNMNSALLIGAQLRDTSETYYDNGTPGSSVVINYTNGHFQKVTTDQNISITFTNFPSAGQHGWVKLLINKTGSHTVTLPAAVSQGIDTIQGVTSNVLSASVSNGNYLFLLETVDEGSTIFIQDLLRNRDIISQGEQTTLTQLVVTEWANVTNTATSTSTTTGALVVAGGVGVSGSLWANTIVGGSVRPSGNGTPTFGLINATSDESNLAIANLGVVTNTTIRWQFTNTGNLVPHVTGAYDIGDGTRKPRDITALRILKTNGSLVADGTEDLASGSAANLSTHSSYIQATGAETATLAAGTEGQIKVFAYLSESAGGDSMVITVTNPAWGGAGTITLGTVGQACTLQYINSLWVCIGNNGASFA